MQNGKDNNELDVPISRPPQNKEDFIQYLRVLFPLIEGSSDPESIRPDLYRFLRNEEVPANIKSMLRDLFSTKFNETLY